MYIFQVYTYSCLVVECSPEIPQMTSLTKELNQTQDFILFLKRVRQEFVSSVQ